MDVVDGRPHVAKVRVAGSNPVFRSKENPLLSRGFLYFKPWLGTILERLRVEGAMLWRWVSLVPQVEARQSASSGSAVILPPSGVGSGMQEST